MEMIRMIRSRHLVGLVTFAVIGIYAIATPLSVKAVDLACDENNGYEENLGSEGCLGRNWKAVQDKIGYEEFKSVADGCMAPRSWERDNNAGACVNAVRSCYEHAIDKTACNGELTGNIANECGNWGDESGDVGADDDCDPLAAANQTALDNIEQSIRGKAVSCTGSDSSNPDLDKQAQCIKTYNSAVVSCAKQQGFWTSDTGRYGADADAGDLDGDNAEYIGVDGDKYEMCINDYIRENTTVPEQCTGMGGIYIDKLYEDPTGGDSDVPPGCKALDSDLINKDACAAGAASSGKKLVWMQTGGKDTKTTDDDAWGCEKDEDGDGKADVDKDDPDAECPKDLNGNCATITATNQHCGDARVNLLGCGEGTKGADAFTAILKIIIIVLTVLVGIAAVGGLAYAALTYARAEDNSGTVSEAKTLIRNIVIGIVLYGFLIAIVTWLVPGLSLT